ncbi:RCC1 and BTB domain-containing protein 2 [Seminavis robusta]|uniref:RCC1 and BTB domain-containing protein 2 n=1 Tax=Seminavis robusta TaxID=568900 RepID=A0A9N8EI47_9STRA|nr:RCC1 and BTB domain-containing protein 2 [Seminavis robusta]|eukprot:Sro1028_g233150.1 RCC1 and BTB domain-containing protein 2 (1543) ;mRNA; f:17382-22010
MSGRRRSSSLGIATGKADASLAVPSSLSLEALEATQKLWELVFLAMEDPTSKQTLLHSSGNVCLIKALLDRAHQLDHYSRSASSSNSKTNNNNSQLLSLLHNSQWLSTMLQHGDGESGYTPLHRAVLQADLPVILLLLRYSMALSSKVDSSISNKNREEEKWTSVMSKRLLHRPLALLQGGDGLSIHDDARAVLQTMDAEGLTAFQLMQKLQIKELEYCRKSLVYSPLDGMVMMNETGAARRPRQNSFETMLQLDHAQQVAQQNEFADLHNFMQQEQQRRPTDIFGQPVTANNAAGISYACEVLTFGRSNHLALGVQGGKNHEERTSNKASSSDSTTTLRPYRVQEFAQERVGRDGSAVAVAAAAHHTLVATRQGHLYAFGVGTGGRLGTGDNERHCPAPTRVLGPLQKRRVVAIAAAENHSLCVTSEGVVYAFGSNRFGQLGFTGGDTSSSNDSGSRCCLPRRVDDLWKKHVSCIGVAAGEKHSVALSQKGEVYVWGCNASGQLGINHRRSASNSGAAHKVQRVDSLWNNEKTRVCFQVAASAQATLVLAKPSPGGLPVNQVYAWGHGNHVPAKVHFSDPTEGGRPRGQSKENVFLAAGSGGRSVNPIAIACARHHSAAITSDGRVYTWGFHADTLGASTKAKAANKSPNSRPQLVTGMLPEEGGGFAVAVSTSENHTAVVTNDGSLFTWGASYGKGVMGHEGVRWQPSPKRVGGVSRAVGISAAKEHTVLLMGASFPSPVAMSTRRNATLELLAAQEVVKHVDLFNALPILMTAERTNCRYLMDHCRSFVRLNIDGVLNVGQKSTMEMYLKEHVANGLLLLDEDPRDRRERPLVLDIALATYSGRKGMLEGETVPADPVEWIQACQKLSKNESLSSLLHRMRRAATSRPSLASNAKLLRRRSSSSVGSAGEAESGGRKRSGSVTSDPERDRKMSSSERCIMLTTNMDLSTREHVQAKYDCLTREVRGLKKRLSQIAKLEAVDAMDAQENPDDPAMLSADQREKIARRPQLESELCIFESALERVERRMLQFNLKLKKPTAGCADESKGKTELTDSEKSSGKVPPTSEMMKEETAPGSEKVSLRCSACKIACPDEKSFALHMNGRKHRNRVAQEAEKEKERAAASMMEERHRQQMGEINKGVDSRRASPSTKVSAWSNCKETGGSFQSKYKLSPQENLTQEIVEKQPGKPKSLHEIMEEEAKEKAKTKVSVATSTKLRATSSQALTLPPGSASALKSPPWGNKAMIQASAGLRVPASPILTKPSTGSQWLGAGSKATPIQLPVGAAPTLKSPPWATKPVKTSFPQTSPQQVSSPKLLDRSPMVMPSFGDFLQKAPKTPQSHSLRPSSSPWSPPAVARIPAASKQHESSVSFQVIQKQEEDFKNVQDQSYQDNGKWFIERRERAGSFATIQEAATKQREEQLFIEEQKRIEEHIQREQALKKKKEDALKKKKEKRKRQQAKKAQSKSEGNDGGQTSNQQSQQNQGGKSNQQPAEKNSAPNASSTKSKNGGNRRNRNKNSGANRRTQTSSVVDDATSDKMTKS